MAANTSHRAFDSITRRLRCFYFVRVRAEFLVWMVVTGRQFFWASQSRVCFSCSFDSQRMRFLTDCTLQLLQRGEAMGARCKLYDTDNRGAPRSEHAIRSPTARASGLAQQGVRLQSEWVAEFRRNRPPDCVGITGRLRRITRPCQESDALLIQGSASLAALGEFSGTSGVFRSLGPTGA